MKRRLFLWLGVGTLTRASAKLYKNDRKTSGVNAVSIYPLPTATPTPNTGSPNPYDYETTSDGRLDKVCAY